MFFLRYRFARYRWVFGVKNSSSWGVYKKGKGKEERREKRRMCTAALQPSEAMRLAPYIYARVFHNWTGVSRNLDLLVELKVSISPDMFALVRQEERDLLENCEEQPDPDFSESPIPLWDSVLVHVETAHAMRSARMVSASFDRVQIVESASCKHANTHLDSTGVAWNARTPFDVGRPLKFQGDEHYNPLEHTVRFLVCVQMPSVVSETITVCLYPCGRTDACVQCTILKCRVPTVGDTLCFSSRYLIIEGIRRLCMERCDRGTAAYAEAYAESFINEWKGVVGIESRLEMLEDLLFELNGSHQRMLC